jgi:multiple RNA-binding domain-containing protein 1
VAKFNRIQKPEDVPAEDPKAGQKRKWSDVDEPHLRLKEFLEVMQPASKSTPWAAQSLEDVEPPTKIQAIEIPEADSDQEYEAVPKKPKKKSQAPLELTVPISMEPIIPTKTNNITADLHIPDATDDDWMRNRTNRLLDLMDSADIAVEKSVKLTSKTNAVREVVDKPGVITEKVLGEIEKIEEERGDPVIEAISANGRLFVRNLPYTATEQDLREHFQPYGTLEEVRTCIFPYLALHDEYPDRDNLCFKHRMRTGREF